VAVLDAETMSGGQRGGAVEGGRSEVHGDDGPAARGEPDGVLASTAGQVESAGTRMRRGEQRKGFDEKGGGSGRGLGGGFPVTEVPMLEGGGH